MGKIVQRKDERTNAKIVVEGFYSSRCVDTVKDVLKSLGFKKITYRASTTDFILDYKEGNVNEAKSLIERYGYKVKGLFCLDTDFQTISIPDVMFMNDATKVASILENNGFEEFKLVLDDHELLIPTEYDKKEVTTLLVRNSIDAN